MRWKYHSESIPGNFHHVVEYLNNIRPTWELIAADRSGNNTTIICKIPDDTSIGPDPKITAAYQRDRR